MKRCNKQIKALNAKNTLYKRLKQRILNSKLLGELDALWAKLQSSNYFFFLIWVLQENLIKNDLIHPLVLNAIGIYFYGRKSQPVFLDNKFMAYFKENSEIFNSFFGKQCSLFNNGSTLSSLFPLITGKLLLNGNFSVEAIKSFIIKLDSKRLMVKIWSVLRGLSFAQNSFANILILS